ncbi:MAG TPA: recombinase zinc beta ribbon domain-containing protein, partial [Anaerolineae bacterium]|nr:recombinase zinc beta ribbon domain-containing protein [Anaerolineae bacterium]
SLRRILTNPLYTGQVFAARTRPRATRFRSSPLKPVGRATHSWVVRPPEDWILVTTLPALVSQEQFDLVQAKLVHNRIQAKRNNKSHEYLLRALMSCGACQASCIARTNPPGNAYYVCRAKLPAIKSCRDEKCNSRFIPAPQLDELVWQDLCEVVRHPERIAAALQRAQAGEWLPQELQARRETIRKARVNLSHQVERLTEAYLHDIIPLAEFERRRQELERKCEGLEHQVKQLEANVDRRAELAGLATSIEAFCQRVQTGLEQATFEQRRQLVELLIDRVVVTGEEVEIRYVIPTSASSEHVRFCHLRKDYFNRARPHQGLKQQIPEQIKNANLEAPATNKIIRFPGLKERDRERRSETPAKNEAKSHQAKGKIIAFPILNGLHHDYQRVA